MVYIANLVNATRNNPDIYLVQKGPMNRNQGDPKNRSNFQVLRAVRNGRVMFVDEYLFSRPGPRSVDAAEQLAAFLHPAFAQ